MANEFWLRDAQWAAIDPLLPKNRPGARRVNDRRALSGIVLRIGCRWQLCLACCGPPTTIYNRFHRRPACGLWRRLFRALATASPNAIINIGSWDALTRMAHLVCELYARPSEVGAMRSARIEISANAVRYWGSVPDAVAVHSLPDFTCGTFSAKGAGPGDSG
jgi:transposase